MRLSSYTQCHMCMCAPFYTRTLCPPSCPCTIPTPQPTGPAGVRLSSYTHCHLCPLLQPRCCAHHHAHVRYPPHNLLVQQVCGFPHTRTAICAPCYSQMLRPPSCPCTTPAHEPTSPAVVWLSMYKHYHLCPPSYTRLLRPTSCPFTTPNPQRTGHPVCVYVCVLLCVCVFVHWYPCTSVCGLLFCRHAKAMP